MPKSIPAQLLSDIRKGETTLCGLLRIDPVQPGYASYGAALLDIPVVYDDGISELTYQAIIGAQPSTLVFGSDLAIDGGETTSLLPEYDVPVAEADIVAGAYDFARFTLYKVNYRDLSAGHEIVAHGTLGRFTVNDDGLSFTKELRGLTQRLKQSLTEKWSLGCRATFGSQPGGPDVFPCMYPADTLWQPSVVEDVGLENTRTLVTSGLAPPFGGAPGMLHWLTGANAGRTYEVEEFHDDGGVQTIHLTFNTMFPMQVGDEFEHRDDCPKTPEACKARNNWQWYRGESKIPVADAGQIAVPGASAGIGTGATVTTEYQAE